MTVTLRASIHYAANAMTGQPWFFYTLPVIAILLAILVKVVLSARKDAAQAAPRPAFRRCAQNAAPPEARARQLHSGLMHGQAMKACADTLSTGLNRREVAASLNDVWNITTTEQAQSTLGWLLMEGHRAMWPHVLSIVCRHPVADWTASVYSLSGKVDRDQLQEYLDHLAETLPGLQDDGVLTSEADLARGIIGWDMGRAIHVARQCYDCKLITEAQAWEVIAYASAAMSRELSSWDEVVKSTLIGLAMWAGPGDLLNAMRAIGEQCLNDPDSPWVRAEVAPVSEPASSPA